MINKIEDGELQGTANFSGRVFAGARGAVTRHGPKGDGAGRAAGEAAAGGDGTRRAARARVAGLPPPGQGERAASNGSTS